MRDTVCSSRCVGKATLRIQMHKDTPHTHTHILEYKIQNIHPRQILDLTQNKNTICRMKIKRKFNIFYFSKFNFLYEFERGQTRLFCSVPTNVNENIGIFCQIAMKWGNSGTHVCSLKCLLRVVGEKKWLFTKVRPSVQKWMFF